MRKFYLVFGGESTGTKLMTRLLIEAGCQGDAGDFQRLDDDRLFDRICRCHKRPLVLRRSFPHGKKFPDLGLLFTKLKQFYKYEELMVIVMVRNWPCVRESQKKHGHVATEEQSMKNLRWAYRDIFLGLGFHPELPYILVSYDALVQYPYFYLPLIMRDLGLKLPPRRFMGLADDIKDRNNLRFQAQFSKLNWEEKWR